MTHFAAMLLTSSLLLLGPAFAQGLADYASSAASTADSLYSSRGAIGPVYSTEKSGTKLALLDTDVMLGRSRSANFKAAIDPRDAPYNMKCDGSDEKTAWGYLVAALPFLNGAEVDWPANLTCATSVEQDLNVNQTTFRGRGAGSTLRYLGSGGDFLVFGKNGQGGYYNAVHNLRIMRSDGAAQFTGAINNGTAGTSGTTLKVTSVQAGTLAVGQSISAKPTPFGSVETASIPVEGFITGLGSGTGGVGTYTVSSSQNVPTEAINSGSGPTSGAGLHLIGQGNFYSNNLTMLDFYKDIWIEGGAKIHINHAELTSGEFWPRRILGSCGIDVSPHIISQAAFTGSIAADGMLTVSAVASGAITPGQMLGDVTNALPSGVSITSYSTGKGGTGTYKTNAAAAIASEAMQSVSFNNASGIYLGDPALGGVLGFQTLETSLCIEGVDGLYSTMGHFGNSTYDIKLQPTLPSEQVLTVNLVAPYFDGTGNIGGSGMYVPTLSGTGQHVTQISVTNGSTNTHNNYAFDIEEKTAGPFAITGMQALFEQGPFVYAPSVGQISLTGNICNGCGLNGGQTAVTIGSINKAQNATLLGNSFIATTSCLSVSATYATLSGNAYGGCTGNTPPDQVGSLTVLALLKAGNIYVDAGTVRAAAFAAYAGGTMYPGVSCSGPPSRNYRVVSGVVTHC